jgi:DNA-binding MarR family transcriptional regulator
MGLIEELKDRCISNTLKIRKEANLSHSEYAGISVMTNDEIICGNDLSKKMNLSPSRGSRIIDSLVRNGFLTRENDPEDRRRYTLRLADKGIQVKKRIEKTIDECEKKVFSVLSKEEIKHFSRSIKKINKIL